MTKKLFWAIVGITLIKTVFFSNFGFGLLDEGESLHNGVRILGGELPYKDFFAIFPPLDNYFFAFIFQIFGKSVILPRIIMSLVFAFAPGFLFLILIKFVSKKIALLPVILLIFLDLNIERLYFFTPIFLAIYLIENNSLLAGLLLGFTSLIRADLPGTYLIGLGLFLLLNKQLKKIIYLVIGYLLPIILVILWMQANNILNLFFISTTKYSIAITKLHHLPFPPLQAILPASFNLSGFANSYQALYANCILAIYFLFFVFAVIKNKVIFKKYLLLVTLFITGLLALPYVFGRSDMGHIVKGTMPVLFLASFLFSKLKSQAIKFLFLTIYFVVLIASIGQHVWWMKFNNIPTNINGYTVRLNSTVVPNSTAVSAATLEKSVSFLKHSALSEKVLALPYMAGLYFLADREPPSEFNNLLAGFISTIEDEKEFISKIKANNINYIVYAPESGPKMEKNKLREYNPSIHEFIMANYKIIEQTNDGWLLMYRNADFN